MKRFAQKLGGKKKADDTPVTQATKAFIKGTGDEGLSSLPSILEACSVSSQSALGATIEVLDLITHYFGQKGALSRQARCVDLLRYLSDSNEIELFPLISQNLTFLSLLEKNAQALSNSDAANSPQAARHLESMTRVLIDHFCLKPDVPQQITALQQKLNVGATRSRAGRPSQGARPVTEEQQAIKDVEQAQFKETIEGARSECELMAALLCEPGRNAQSETADPLEEEMYEGLIRRREMLAKFAEARLSEQQMLDLVAASEKIDETLQLYSDVKDTERQEHHEGQHDSQQDTTWQGLDMFGTNPNLSYSAPSPVGKGKGYAPWPEAEPNGSWQPSQQIGFLDAGHGFSDDGAPGSSRSSARSVPFEEKTAAARAVTPIITSSNKPTSEWSPRSNNPFNTNPFTRQQPAQLPVDPAPSQTNPFL